MKIGLTGATGFIGRHVVAELENAELENRSISPVLFCRPSATVPAALSKHRVIALDVHGPAAGVFETAGNLDVLIHLAWVGLPNYNSLHHFESELPAQYRFLKTAVESGVKHLVVTGTCFEYGMKSGPLSESTEPAPRNPYGFAKDTLRRQLEYLQQVKPFNLTWARLFYLYGDGQAKNSLLPQLEAAVCRGDSVFNMSGGEQLRDYMPVAEVARILVSLGEPGANPGEVNHGAVNVCSGKPISVRRLVEQWLEERGWDIKLNRGHFPYPSWEPMAFWGTRDKLDSCLEQS